MPCWLGVDVGAKRKGFDVAIVDERRLMHLAARLSCDAVVRLAEASAPTRVGIDSPRCWAPEGETARLGERLLNRAVCGIRWTPDVRAGAENGYYGWIREGLALFGALEALGIAVIEVFPTASWTRWHGDRGAMTRARWSRAALESLDLEGIPQRSNQDQRDAIAAAVTARQHTMQRTEAFGEIIVPAIPA